MIKRWIFRMMFQPEITSFLLMKASQEACVSDGDRAYRRGFVEGILEASKCVVALYQKETV